MAVLSSAKDREIAAERKQRRKDISTLKQRRRLAVGPFATFHFECYETMWMQIHEMPYIEKGGEQQIGDELAAYNPLIPKGRELIVTVMFEIDDPDLRARFLAGLGGIEETMTLEFDGETVAGVPEADVDRTTADGKASSVQFVHFPFADDQVEKFQAPGARAVSGTPASANSRINASCISCAVARVPVCIAVKASP